MAESKKGPGRRTGLYTVPADQYTWLSQAPKPTRSCHLTQPRAHQAKLTYPLALASNMPLVPRDHKSMLRAPLPLAAPGHPLSVGHHCAWSCFLHAFRSLAIPAWPIADPQNPFLGVA